MQARAAADLRKLATDGLVERGLTYEGAAAYAGPRPPPGDRLRVSRLRHPVPR